MKTYKMTLGLLALIIILVTSSFLKDKTPVDELVEIGGWVKLGTQTVNLGVDHDVLDIMETEQTYNHLKFKVSKAPVYIRNIHIIYNDNTSEGHIITHQFKKGEASRIFDLLGYGRVIKKVIFNYSDRSSVQKQAELVVMAKL